MRRFIEIVENAQQFMFHATRESKLDGIRAHGLIPNGDEPNWDGYPVDGRLYVSTSESGAEWYAGQLSEMYEEPTVVLRFPTVPTQQDEFGNGPQDRYTTETIPPNRIEIKTEAGWQPLAALQLSQPEPEPVVQSPRREYDDDGNWIPYGS